jgi:hypothetical protein
VAKRGRGAFLLAVFLTGRAAIRRVVRALLVADAAVDEVVADPAATPAEGNAG